MRSSSASAFVTPFVEVAIAICQVHILVIGFIIVFILLFIVIKCLIEIFVIFPFLNEFFSDPLNAVIRILPRLKPMVVNLVGFLHFRRLLVELKNAIICDNNFVVVKFGVLRDWIHYDKYIY